MMEVFFHIENDNVRCDRDVCFSAEMPTVPRIGEIVLITGEQEKKLRIQARSSLDIAKRYAPRWFYGPSFKVENPSEKNLRDLSFADAAIVSNVLYDLFDNTVHVEIDFW